MKSINYFAFVILFIGVSLLSCTKDDNSNELAIKFGLGKVVSEECSNNVNYNWYIDQTTTGKYASINCGPSCVTMAIKWVDPAFSKEAVDAREAYGSEGGGWPISYITNYLNDNGISHTTLTAINANAKTLKNQLKSGNITILALDAYYIRKHEGDPELRIYKYYTTYSSPVPHYIIAKGYKVVDNILWFEIYDPAGFYERYKDGTPRGRDRYYRSDDIINAMEKLYFNAIPMVVVKKK